jgi:SAM-dependent methyltransferase
VNGGTGESVPPEEFERFFASGQDPYGFRSRWYERRKRDLTMASLRSPRYGRVLELGGAEGALSEMLALRADEVVTVDASSTAVERAVRALSGMRNVDVRLGTLPGDFPNGEFDLVVMAEIGYFLSERDLQDLVDRSVACLAPDGELIAVHWREPSEHYPLHGDLVHAIVRRHDELVQRVAHDEEEFVLDVWVRA